jgi:hypothetical protein
MAVSYLVKRQITVTNTDNEGKTHYAGDVISDWELPKHIKDKITEGVGWYTQNFEALTDKEAELYRRKATSVEGKRTAPDGQICDPPWDDYIGLHPKDVVGRMKDLSADDSEKVRQYERAGLNRDSIIEYVAPSEREPWYEYDNWGPRDILEKLEILDPQTVQDAIVYEMQHKKRPAILTFEPEPDDPEVIISANSALENNGPELVAAGVGADEGKEQ